MVELGAVDFVQTFASTQKITFCIGIWIFENTTLNTIF